MVFPKKMLKSSSNCFFSANTTQENSKSNHQIIKCFTLVGAVIFSVVSIFLKKNWCCEVETDHCESDSLLSGVQLHNYMNL